MIRFVVSVSFLEMIVSAFIQHFFVTPNFECSIIKMIVTGDILHIIPHVLFGVASFFFVTCLYNAPFCVQYPTHNERDLDWEDKQQSGYRIWTLRDTYPDLIREALIGLIVCMTFLSKIVIELITDDWETVYVFRNIATSLAYTAFVFYNFHI